MEENGKGLKEKKGMMKMTRRVESVIDGFITALLIGEQKRIQQKRKAACHRLLLSVRNIFLSVSK